MKESPEKTTSVLVLDPVVEAYRKDVDVSLIRENLRLSVSQRFEQLMKLQRFAEELQQAGSNARQNRD
jgi:hypothetical protein